MKNQLIGKVPDAGKDWGQEEKGLTENEMVGWHHRLGGHEFEQTPKDSEGQGSLVRAAVRGVTKSLTRFSDWTATTVRQPFWKDPKVKACSTESISLHGTPFCFLTWGEDRGCTQLIFRLTYGAGQPRLAEMWRATLNFGTCSLLF